ncbi:MAG: DUF1847 domain-containing protein [Desulfuromonadaceae bacterium]|nr:DUF1847 domain-containing protein [Desulfuromonadaceae bacterium]
MPLINEEKPAVSCGNCSTNFRTKGTTNCWSEPSVRPPRPKNCPSDHHTSIVDEAFSELKGDSEDARLAKVASIVEGLCYEKVEGSDAVCARWNRVEDTVALAKLMGWKKIGIATCIGLLEETRQLDLILKAQGFDSYSVCCKSGSIDKLDVGVAEHEKIRPGTFEPACNPIAQARILAEYGTEMNIIVGLCVGHDMLFAKYSTAPVTTMVTKDRVTGHNPVAALYGQNFYYKRLQKIPILPDAVPIR